MQRSAGIGPGSFPPHGFPRFLGFDSKTVQRSALCRSRRELSNEPVFPGLDQDLFPPMVFLVFWDSIPKRCKGVHCLDLGESFPTSIYLQKSASIQPRTSPSKFGEKFNSLFTSLLNRAAVAAQLSGQRLQSGRKGAMMALITPSN